MEAKLKIPFALRDGHFIHISEVESGTKHGGVCSACNSPLIARKGKTVTHHFAHQPDANCSVETALHKTAKLLLYLEIKEAMSKQRDVPVSWKCSRCGDQHAGSLLRKARTVRLEHSFAVCRPDLTLLDEHDRPIAVIEVVVSHAPEDHVRKFCDDEKIALLEYHVTGDFALEALHPLNDLRATIGSVCTRKKCPECKAPLRSVELYIGDGKCWKCRAVMKMALISRDGRPDGPAEFDTATVAAAREKGANFRERSPNDAGKRLLANSCSRCGSLTSEFFLIDFGYLACGNKGTLVGYECSKCDWRRSV